VETSGIAVGIAFRFALGNDSCNPTGTTFALAFITASGIEFVEASGAALDRACGYAFESNSCIPL
jgi:hypothetical protein